MGLDGPHMFIGTFKYKYKTLENIKPAQGWMVLADSRQRTSPPQGWDSCSSLLWTGHKMFWNWYRTKSDLLTWMKWDTPSVSKYWATTAPEETILFTCNNSFVDFKEEICFLFHFFFHLEPVPFLLHKKHCIGVWVDRLGAEIFVFLLKLFFAKKTLSVPLFLMSQIQTPLQRTVRRTWVLTT